MKLVASMTERCAGSVLSRTMLFSTGLLVCFAGAAHGLHHSFAVHEIPLMLERLQLLATTVNADDTDVEAIVVEYPKVPVSR